jgi:hypothetical protein
MHARSLLPIVLAFALTSFADPPADDSRPSPDGRWIVSWHCKRTWQPDSCGISLSRQPDGKVFFTHQTNDRYIQAAWSSDSSKCVLLDAPDNANSYLWLFRVRVRHIATEKLDYEKISADIEAAVPAARRQEPAITRSGIEKIEWSSSSELRLLILYNNVPVLVVVDVAQPNSPNIRVLSRNET